MTDFIISLIKRIDRAIRKYDELSGYSSTHELGEPAKETDILSLERELEISLPPDYRNFLLLHNGWADFEGEVALLSTDEMHSGTIFDHVQDLKHIYREEHDDIAATGIVIAASPTGSSIKFFDVSTRRPNGTMDVVEWDGEEIIRHKSFTEYLKFTAESWERLISEIIEKEKDI